jgi:predicted RNase H-like HicB family nuclease
MGIPVLMANKVGRLVTKLPAEFSPKTLSSPAFRQWLIVTAHSLHSFRQVKKVLIECLSFHVCASRVDKIEEALEMIKDAIKGHLEVMVIIHQKEDASEQWISTITL